MRYTMLPLSLLIVGVSLGCTERSDRYQGISEPREITSERSPATRPSLPTAEVERANHPSPAVDDTDSPGTTNRVNNVREVEPATPERKNLPGAQTRNGREVRATFLTVPKAGLEAEAELEEVEGGVHVTVSVQRATPGRRGVHVHEKGNCTDIPGKSMGGHFAPDGHKHGLPGYAEHHLGDLGNINVGKHGEGELDITVPYATLAAGHPKSFAGRALVIHSGEDEGARSQPSGNSGAPIACAVIAAK